MSDEEVLNIDDAGEEETVDDGGDEEQETNTEEEETPAPVDSEDSDEAPEEEAPNEEDGLEWDEWRKQHGLPDGIKDEDELAQAYLAMLPEMKQGQTASGQLAQVEAYLAQNGLPGGVTSLLNGGFPNVAQSPQSARQSGGETYFSKNPVKDVVESMIEGGTIPDENKAAWKAQATVLDRAFAPQLQLVDDALTQVLKQNQSLVSRVRGMEWNSLDKGLKSSVRRADVDATMDRFNFDTYDEAIRYMAFQNPALLRDVTKDAFEKGKKKERQKLRKSKKALRRGSGTPRGKSYDYSKYQDLDGNWDQNKLAAMGDEGVKILEAYEKQFKK